MPAAYTDPRFIGAGLSLVLGGARVLGPRPTAPVIFGARLPSPGEIGRQAAARLSTGQMTAESAWRIFGDLSQVRGATDLASDPTAQAAAVRGALWYMDVINRSLGANAPLSGDGAAAVVGSGDDITSGMAPLAVIDRITALDETWGPAVEGYRRTFAGQTSPTLVTVEIRPVVAGGPDWQEVGGAAQRFTSTQLLDLARAGRVQWVAPGIINPGPLNSPAARVTIERGAAVTGDYITRLAVLRATTEALVWARDVLAPFGAPILEDATGKLRAEWVAYLSTFAVTGEDLQAMARQIAAGNAPRPSAMEQLLGALSGGLSFVMGGLSLLNGALAFAGNISAGAPLDPLATGAEAGRLTQQALQLYGSGVRLSAPEQGAASSAAATLLAPEEGRILQFLAQGPDPQPVVRINYRTQAGMANPGTRRLTYLQGLSGMVPPKQYLDAIGGAAGYEDLQAALLAAPGVLSSSTASQIMRAPGGLALKCVLLARRWPIVTGGMFSQVFSPRGPARLPGVAI